MRKLTSRQKGDLFWVKFNRLEADKRRKGLDRKERIVATGSKILPPEGDFVCRDLMSLDDPFEKERISRAIPENLLEQVYFEDLKAVAVFLPGTEEELCAAYVFGIHYGMMELVWLHLFKRAFTVEERAALIRYITGYERYRSVWKLSGVFSEIHAFEMSERMKQVLELAGMTVERGRDNIYEFTLSDLAGAKELAKAAKRVECTAFRDCDAALFAALEEAMAADPRGVPVPEDMTADGYLQNISCICREKESIRGALFIDEYGGSLVVRLAWTKDPMALGAMLGFAIQEAEKAYLPDQEVLVPVVVPGTEARVEKLVPGSERWDFIRAGMEF